MGGHGGLWPETPLSGEYHSESFATVKRLCQPNYVPAQEWINTILGCVLMGRCSGKCIVAWFSHGAHSRVFFVCRCMCTCVLMNIEARSQPWVVLKWTSCFTRRSLSEPLMIWLDWLASNPRGCWDHELAPSHLASYVDSRD